MAQSDEELAKIFSGYLKTRKVLIADPSKASRTALVKIMGELGAKPENLLSVEKYDEALALLKAEKPNVVICEYDMEKRCGLDLMQSFRLEFPNTKESLFALITANASQSVVAQAAEEDVDTFILKPFTAGILRQILVKAAIAKIKPSTYTQAIEKGKTLLVGKDFDAALAAFDEAVPLDHKPSLAHYYRGQANAGKELFEKEEECYEAGLVVNKLHYKCLNGLYENLTKQKKYLPAYEVITKLSRYYPANPKRLAAVLRLAIMTKNYDDIERYYQSFTTIDQKEEELIQYVCAALVVCGKYYIKTNFHSRALELFNNAAITAGERTKFLKEIVVTLNEYNFYRDAMLHLMRYPLEAQQKDEFLALNYALLDRDADQPPQRMIDMGKELVKGGHSDPIIYRLLIKRLSAANDKDAANTYKLEASTKFPAEVSSFERAFGGSLINAISGI